MQTTYIVYISHTYCDLLQNADLCTYILEFVNSWTRKFVRFTIWISRQNTTCEIASLSTTFFYKKNNYRQKHCFMYYVSKHFYLTHIRNPSFFWHGNLEMPGSSVIFCVLILLWALGNGLTTSNRYVSNLLIFSRAKKLLRQFTK